MRNAGVFWGQKVERIKRREAVVLADKSGGFRYNGDEGWSLVNDGAVYNRWRIQVEVMGIFQTPGAQAQEVSRVMTASRDETASSLLRGVFLEVCLRTIGRILDGWRMEVDDETQF